MTFLNLIAVQKTFQNAASTYDLSARLYREVGDRLLEHLDWVRIRPEWVLDLGASTGYITQLLEKRYPYAQVVAVDFAKKMLQQSKHTYALCADAAKLPLLDASVDLIVSGLMLPWCKDIPTVLIEMQRVLKPGGLLLFSTFGPDTLGELRASWATVDTFPHVHLFFDLHDLGDALLRARFADPITQTEWLTLIYPDACSLFKDLKNAGATNLLQEQRQTLTGKNRFQKFLAEYNTYKNEAQKLPATFEIIYGHCWKFDPPVRGDEIIIPVSSLKKLR